MSMTTRYFAARASPALRRAHPRLLSRQYSESPYPFTKPDRPQRPVETLNEAASESTDKAMTVRGGAADKAPSHKPDYTVAADYRISPFSPIPTRVMDGSEPSETVPAAVLSGAPVELQARTVRIYQPAKTATQSGDWHGHHWRLDWDILHKGHRWENPLMGWQSSADFMQGTHMNFKTKEDAIRFAEKQGYEYFVQEPSERRFVPKAYASQFVHIPKKLKQVRTK